MNTTRLFSGLIVLLLISELLSCTDHRIPAVTPGINRLRVKSITQQLTPVSSVSTVSAFSYDNQNRLSSILAYQVPDSASAPVENTVYQYDAQNRLTQAQHSVVRRGSNLETYTFVYNSAGQLSNFGNSPSTFSISLQYDAANRVSSYSKGISVAGLQSSGGGALTFTGNNLTASSETFSIIRSGGPSIPVFSRATSSTYTFDDKLNPFYGIYIIPAPGVFLPGAGVGSFGPFYTLYGGIDNSFNLSQNNVLSVVTSGTSTATTTCAYTYNAANLPTTRLTTSGGSVTEILRFEYEPY